MPHTCTHNHTFSCILYTKAQPLLILPCFSTPSIHSSPQHLYHSKPYHSPTLFTHLHLPLPTSHLSTSQKPTSHLSPSPSPKHFHHSNPHTPDNVIHQGVHVGHCPGELVSGLDRLRRRQLRAHGRRRRQGGIPPPFPRIRHGKCFEAIAPLFSTAVGNPNHDLRNFRPI